MDNNTRQKAFHLATEAAKLDFESALQGLMEGHKTAMDQMREALTKKDVAFLMALALTEKGARLDKEGIMEGKIAEGIRAIAFPCGAEKKFLARVDGD